MKGQMFLAAAVLIVLGIISMSNLLGIYKTAEETRLQESLMLDRQLGNIRSEFEAAAAAARLAGKANDSAIVYISNLSSLVRSTADAEIIYSFIFYNGTSGNYSVTVGNYLGDRINATINVTNSANNGYFLGVLEDMTNSTRTFNASITSGTIQVNITYALRGENITESLPFGVSASHALLFYDIKLSEGKDFVRIKDTYNMTW